MADLLLTKIQPNPPGKDATYSHSALQLNNEWVEFQVQANTRSMTNDTLTHITYSQYGCTISGPDTLFVFGTISLTRGQSVRIHSGSGTAWWEGATLHVYAGRSWYVWNNECGDRAAIIYNGSTLDWAEYSSSPREGVLTRVPYTNRFE